MPRDMSLSTGQERPESMKKNEYRFTIQFNPHDPRQQRAAEILNSCPQRGKAVMPTNLLIGSSPGLEEAGAPVWADKRKEKGANGEIDAETAEKISSALDMFG